MAQTQAVVQALATAHPDVTIELVSITTDGDQDRRTALHHMGGQGVFTKALEHALRDRRVDFAVHSAKDLPSVMDDDLAIAAVPTRASAADAWISRDGSTIEEIKAGALVGTGSPRRKAQLLHLRNDLRVGDIRGNVETRVGKLRDGQYDAIVMAQAGLTRAAISVHIAQVFDTSVFLPAPGQGALAVQCRAGDEPVSSVLQSIDDADSHRCLDIERALLAELKAGCSTPIGGIAAIDGDRIMLRAIVLDEEGTTALRAEHSITQADSDNSLVDTVVGHLIEQGAEAIVRAYDGHK